MQDAIRLLWASSRYYAEIHPQQAMATLAAGVVLAMGFIFISLAWTKLFNRSYKLSGLEWVGTTLTALFGCTLLFMWIGLDFAKESVRAEISGRLKGISMDSEAMREIRLQVHSALPQQVGADAQDPALLAPTERWRFTGRPEDASILAVAKAYADAVAEAIGRQSAFLSEFLSWGSAPSFLAADIHLHATKKPEIPYNLDPGDEAFADILVSDLGSRIAAYVVVVRVVSAAIMVLSITAILAWFAFSAYRDIEVHWPSNA